MRPLQRQIIKNLHVNPSIDVKEEVRKRVDFLKDYLIRSGANGFVLGISGGVDSTCAGKLAQIAINELNNPPVGKYEKEFKFVAVRLPYGIQKDESDAQMALEFIQPNEIVTFNIKDSVDAFSNTFFQALGENISDFNKGNVKARMRMIVQYAIAGKDNLLVVGTDHAAENVTGFFTKFGDGAADLLPLYGLTKNQVRKIAEYLGAPKQLYDKTPTADLLDNNPGRPDEDELGLSYEIIDNYLEGKDIPREEAIKLERQYIATNHKRKLPITPFDQYYEI